MKFLMIGLIRLYQRFASPVLRALSGGQPTCRFTPSCSHYFVQALEHHGILKGTLFGIKRILRCHPWGGSGYDPISKKDSETNSSKTCPDDH